MFLIRGPLLLTVITPFLLTLISEISILHAVERDGLLRKLPSVCMVTTTERLA